MDQFLLKAGWFLLKVFWFICTVVVGRGFLLWLGTKGIHPERWIAAMMGQVESAVANASAIRWYLAGAIGFLGLALWYLLAWWWHHRADLGLAAFVTNGAIVGAVLGIFAGLAAYAWKLPTKEAVIEKPMAGREQDGWYEHRFDLMSPEGEIRIGKCPGPDCFVFRLTGVSREEGVAFQKFVIEGDGLRMVYEPSPIRFSARNMFRLVGRGAIAFDHPTKSIRGWIALDLQSQIAICSEVYDMWIRIPSVEAQTLTLLLLVKSGTWFDGPSEGKCSWIDQVGA